MIPDLSILEAIPNEPEVFMTRAGESPAQLPPPAPESKPARCEMTTPSLAERPSQSPRCDGPAAAALQSQIANRKSQISPWARVQAADGLAASASGGPSNTKDAALLSAGPAASTSAPANLTPLTPALSHPMGEGVNPEAEAMLQEENSGVPCNRNPGHETPRASGTICEPPKGTKGAKLLTQKALDLGAWRARTLLLARKIRRDHAAKLKEAGVKNPPAIPYERIAVLVGSKLKTFWQLEHDFAHLTDAELTAVNCAGKFHAAGRKSGWAYLLDDPEVQRKLRENYAASLASSCELATHDRHTGDMTKAIQHFAREPECPEALAKKLLQRKIPSCFTRFLRRITPEMEAYIRGPKAFQLQGHSGQRAKLIALPDSQAAYMPAGWIWELDDMSVNQPYWVEAADGSVILSRQGLFCRCVKGRWLGVDLVARVRESYTSGDILRCIQRLFELYGGMPRKLRIERSVWAAANIAGYKLTADGEWTEEEIERPEMGAEDRMNLSLGLRALGIEVEYCHSARGKSDLEGAFHPLQAHLAQFTKDFVNIGRRRGEFERMAKQLRRVRAGSHHPGDLGFAHQNQLIARIQDTFDWVNIRLPIPGKRSLHDVLLGGAPVSTLDELWQRDLAVCPLLPIPEDADLAFLPVLRQPAIRGGAIFPRVDGLEYPFRAQDLAELGDGYAVYVRFDPGDLTRGAAIYNREKAGTARNHRNYAEGALICRAPFDAPGFTAHAFEVPGSLPRVNVEQIYGRDVLPDGGALLRSQQTWARKAVRSAFTGRLPGQPATRVVAARDGQGNAVEMQNAECRMQNAEVRRPAAAPLQPDCSAFAPRTPARTQDTYAAMFGG